MTKKMNEKIEYLNSLDVEYELLNDVVGKKWENKYGKGGIYKQAVTNILIKCDSPFTIELENTSLDNIKSTVERYAHC